MVTIRQRSEHRVWFFCLFISSDPSLRARPCFCGREVWHLYFLLPLFLASPCGMQDFSSPSRNPGINPWIDWIHIPCIGSVGVLTTGPPRKSSFFFSIFLSPPAFRVSLSAPCESIGDGTLCAEESHNPLKAVPFLPFPVGRYGQRGKNILEQAVWFAPV